MGDSADQQTTQVPSGGIHRPVPRHGRAALLQLARWFDDSDTVTAHDIFTAAFATYGARHLGSLSGGSAAATTSWWNAPQAHTADSRATSALPVAPVQDHTHQRARLRDEAEASAHWRRSAAHEVRSTLHEPTGEDAYVHLSGLASQVVMELLTAALGSEDATRGPVSAGDLELGIRLHAQRSPTASLTLRSSGGDLTLEGLRLRATTYAFHPAEFDSDTPAEKNPPETPDADLWPARQA